jgi:hypothetical protein
MYTKKVIEYYNNEDTREHDDLADHLENGAYSSEIGGVDQSIVDDLALSLRSRDELSRSQISLLKKVNHIGAFIILAHLLENK